jgi:hypothetical protein
MKKQITNNWSARRNKSFNPKKSYSDKKVFSRFKLFIEYEGTRYSGWQNRKMQRQFRELL